jgi:hypothetical protein
MRRYTRLLNGFSRKLEDHSGCHGPKLFRLQLYQDSSYTSHVPSNGGWRDGSALGSFGLGCPLGVIRTAEGGKSSVRHITFDGVLTVAMVGLVIWRLWYGEKIGEDRLENHVQKLFPEGDQDTVSK